MKNLFLAILAIVAFASCGNEIEEPADLRGAEYFPLEENREWVYAIDSTIYLADGTLKIESSSYIREVIREQINGEVDDEKLYRLEISSSQSPEGPWTITDIYTVGQTDNLAFRDEENLRFIKLVFPLTASQTWDGHRFFDDEGTFDVFGETMVLYQDWEYSVTEVGVSRNVGGTDFADVVVVKPVDTENLVSRRFVEEVYAKDIGLISRELLLVDTQNFETSLSWEDRAQKGFSISQRLVSYK